jgi:hypothetical protein
VNGLQGVTTLTVFSLKWPLGTPELGSKHHSTQGGAANYSSLVQSGDDLLRQKSVRGSDDFSVVCDPKIIQD